MLKNELYAVLGVGKNAPECDIKTAYRLFVKKYHPDISSDKRIGCLFSRITGAYDELMRLRRNTLIETRIKKTKTYGAVRQKKAVELSKMGKLLKDGRSSSIKKYAIAELSRSNMKIAYGYLKSGLYDKDKEVQKAAVGAIGKLKIYQSAGELGSLFLRSDRDLKIEILNAVGKMARHSAFNHIISSGLCNNDAEVRARTRELLDV